MPFWRRAEKEPALELYYASDIHGSDLLWRKFLGAAKFYEADALVMGGDLCGKAVVPVQRLDGGRYRARVIGEERTAQDDDGLAEIVDAIRFNGFYPWVATPEEIANADGDLFDRLVKEDMRRWLQIAEERSIRAEIFVMAGNDDPFYVDELLADTEAVTFCDDRVVKVGEHEMISLSWANRTPWDSPRELDEDDLYTRVKALADRLEAPDRAIFNLHVPPYDSGLDRAPELDETLTPKMRGGQTAYVPVGSTAVRQAIEDYQPLLALHGHIHESRGEARIGRTLAINSGSEYNTGRLHGVVVRVAADHVISHQFVVG
jgi:Icc-related predicted phosphoesterase